LFHPRSHFILDVGFFSLESVFLSRLVRLQISSTMNPAVIAHSLMTKATAPNRDAAAVGRAATGHSIFTLECHLNYFHEVKQDAQVHVRTQLLGHGHKRLHLYHSLHSVDAVKTLASNEHLLTNVDVSGPRAAPFAGPVLARLQSLAQSHRDLPVPPHVGRVIRLLPDKL
jgi:acyl-CoA thioester hydrolase